MKKWIVLIVLIAAAGGWWFFQRGREEQPQYQTVPVARGDMTQVVTATGALNPVVNVTVGSQISGIIYKLFADFNSPVKADQVVAQIDPSTYQAIVHQMEGDLANAKAALELAQLTASRKKELVQERAAAQADLDSAFASLHQAEATVQIKEANLEKARVDLERCTIKSPIDGTVISRSVDVGQTVAATMNAPVLFTIANDLTKMQIDAAVAEADVGTVEKGQTVDFSVDAFPYRTFHGTVEQVRNAATTVQNVVTYDVVISVDNPDLKLKPGMTASVSIIVAQRDDVVKVTNAALRFRPPETVAAAAAATPASPAPPAAGMRRPGGGGRRAGPRAERKVYVLAPGAANPEPVSVKLGISDGIATEVLEGLKEGDLVVTAVSNPPKAPAPTSSNPLSGGSGRRF
ncbi:MAG: HlyD family secretion protein [Chthoniobacter sp.]|jgi:HlyD family secretion protein|nr:HlyD family secretion protein [Chthoniobacter sp.]